MDKQVDGVDKSLVSFENALNSLIQQTQSINNGQNEDDALAQLSMKLQSDAVSLEQDLASVEQKNLAWSRTNLSTEDKIIENEKEHPDETKPSLA